MTNKVVIAFFLCAYANCAAYGQDRIESSMSDTLSEVVVVSQRTRALQQSSSNAVSQVYLKRLEIEQRHVLKDLSALVPNLYVPDYGSKMTSSIYVRGLGARIDNPVMGMYIDGIGLANKNSYDYEMFDIRSVSVYRGPQGTLYGRNTIGGIVDVSTLSPLTYQGTRASVGYGNANTFNSRLSHYNKIGESFGIGIGAYYKHTDGFFQNHYPEAETHQCDWSNEAGGRMRAEWKGENGTSISNTLIYNWVNQSGFPYHFKDKPISYNDFCGYQRSNLIEGLGYILNIGQYQLNGTTSYQFLSDQMNMDQDYQPLSYFTLIQAQQEHNISQELSFKPLRRAGNQSWIWITGLSLSYTHRNMNAPVTFKQDGIDSLILKNANNGIATAFPAARIMIEENQFVIGSRFTTQNYNAAIYHTSYYNWGAWKFEAGLRLDFEYSDFFYSSSAIIHYLFTETMPNYRRLQSILSGKEHLWYIEPLPKIAVSYKGRNWKGYVSVSEGYKAGGFNTQLFSDILQNTMMNDMMADMGVYFDNTTSDYDVEDVITYKPERCLQTEVGASFDKTVNNSRFSGSATLFWLEVFNQQLTVFPQQGTGRLMTNAGKSRSLGTELTFNYYYQDLSVTLDYGYTNAKFVSYDNGKADYSGNYVPYVPTNTLSTSVNYRFQLENDLVTALDVNANLGAYGTIWWNEENTINQPFYALLGANVILHTKYFDFELWGKNLTNTKYDTFYFVSMGNAFMQSNKPLSFGVKINFEF